MVVQAIQITNSMIKLDLNIKLNFGYISSAKVIKNNFFFVTLMAEINVSRRLYRRNNSFKLSNKKSKKIKIRPCKAI